MHFHEWNVFLCWSKFHGSLLLRVQLIINNPALVKIIAWRRIGAKPLSEPMLTRFTDVYIYAAPKADEWTQLVTSEGVLRYHSELNYLQGKALLLATVSWCLIQFGINLLRLGDLYLSQWTGLSLVQVMSCTLRLDTQEQVSGKFK